MSVRSEQAGAASPDPLLPVQRLAELADGLRAAGYTADGVRERLGPAGDAALARGDLPEAARHAGDDALIRMFLLGETVPAAALHALVGPLVDGGFVSTDGGHASALLDLRPYAEGPSPTAPAGRSWWVVSDLGAEVRPGPLRSEHVLGVGSAALLLAGVTSRRPVRTALDVGTGSGVQSLHLSGHAERVTATDLSRRALRLAATTAALNGLSWELLAGDLLTPVTGRRFDLVVANPPFVLGPPGDGYVYRQGDDISRRLVSGLGAVLAPDGRASVLANWAITADVGWTERVAGWVAGSGCDAWIWQREVADPGEYVSLWLRDGGLRPGDPQWAPAHRAWRDWFDATGVLAVGMGVVSLRRTDRAVPLVVAEDVPQALAQPVGADVDAWFERTGRLADSSDEALLTARLRRPEDLVRTTRAVAGPQGWDEGLLVLRQAGGMRWEIETDADIARVVAGCGGGAALGDVLDLLALADGLDPAAVRAAALPVIRDLVRRGLLLLPAAGTPAAGASGATAVGERS